ncbi:MAG: tandem-95 repeat protein [Sphingobacteriaceae bacterium]|nr:tandem-95 repeat protein [Sphingobacteriaceae bacterium]
MCNLLSPPCSTTTITFTVFPTLTAVANTITTAPATPTTGNLLTNDLGAAAVGATYSVSVTQPATTTGTIVLNPATGQYTFTPNPAFTGTAQTTYTVCNTAVNPTVCSTTSIVIQVGSLPVAVSNTNTTMQNTPVSGNAGTNDTGTNAGLSPVFTNSQPTAGTGTLTMNPSTGQYTFTPATGFTGTTVATYTLCNLLSPPCSTTTITFTVFPTLTAVANTITTAPATPTTGNLLTNDLGAAAVGATYSVSVTQPATTTGTIVLNPATGQYTFTPNPAFTGTAQTTYTVCNTAVNPTVCSTTSIVIQVGSLPVAVSNTNTTMQNTPVSGNAGTNDTGTNAGLSPVFTNSQPTAGTGTLVMNPSTGQYTFTPATGFTGTTVATYTLCNLLSPPCSTTTITFTVFPTLVANPDPIVTTPSVSVTGTLTGNDLGIVPGGTYSVSVTQPAPTTGTITINPATGQYTFVPNPSFTGTAQTTYTVCNTAVNPTVCSNSTITIQVSSLPVAVADATTTMQNTSVSGTVATNDSGAGSSLSPVFTNSQPTAGTGTLTMNPSTGQYTFTPATGFTGTTVATYTLCNLSSPPCSTTTITFTVFPTLVANPDPILTAPSTPTTGNLSTNDLGTSAPGATYSVSVTQPAPTTGTITINPATGQYTFVPNPSFTGTAQTTYTVCNTAVNPTVCSNSTITIMVGDLPLAVADATTTMEGTPVSGTVATNDGGVGSSLSPVFTNSQPTAGTGTLTMNPSTGQYTFTPATGFTGTTVATYTLCNLLSPPCSTTTITFTVFPTLVANPDPIVTTPSVSVTGTLTGNDLGIVPGGTYSVSVTQPASTTGTITINPATGQYTFVPNPSFTGTAQTTYTVCNTAVNPTVCSNSTITIMVGDLPLAVADATTTLINTSVTGTVATNDLGTGSSLSPVFTNGQPTAGTGTLVMNPSTGQYTFTPATGFTGTTVATYTLCNLLSPPCSTTTITFTVFPALVAVDDPIVTTPSVSVTGTLTGNDLGLVPGGTYSTTVTQLSPTTGTITINPATGQYTFVPNPSFTGTAQTTYTVCQYVPPSTVAIQCSTATITINVSDLPIAVADQTVTIINTPVSGTVATNDSGTSGGTFSNSQPTAGTGTLVMNPSTGQYTFTPATGFTGTTVATYTLCNLASPPCSTTTITFTVFPALVAVDDPIVTTPSVSVTGTLTGNDLGLVPGGTYSTTVTQPSPTTGTITINPATGQYTFVPNPTFTGTAQTTYTICQYVPPSTVAIQCSTATITINVSNTPVAVNDGTLTLVNTSVSGNVGTNDSGVATGTFTSGNPTAGTGTIVMNPSTGQYTFTPATGFTGTTAITYTVCDGVPVTCVSAVLTITVYPAIVANPDPIVTTPSVSVTGTLTGNDLGLLPGGTYSTTVAQPSPTTGTIVINPATGQYTFVPNPSFTGTAQTTYTICQYIPPSTVAIQCSTSTISINVNNTPPPIIGVSKSASKPEFDGDGCYKVRFKFTVKNYGASPIYSVTLTDNLNNTFVTPASYTVTSMPFSSNGILVANAGFNGSTDINLVSPTSSLAVGQSDTISIVVRYCTNASGSTVTYSNIAMASANNSPSGTGITTTVVSTNGNNPDPNGNGIPNEIGEQEPTIFVGEGSLVIPQGFSPNGDGTNDLFVIKGIGAYPNNKLNILNRWGNVIYKMDGYDNTWNGKSSEGVKFGSDDLPEGTYFYILDLGNGDKPYKGFIYLNRSVK